jgi:hypothetical protein
MANQWVPPSVVCLGAIVWIVRLKMRIRWMKRRMRSVMRMGLMMSAAEREEKPDEGK